LSAFNRRTTASSKQENLEKMERACLIRRKLSKLTIQFDTQKTGLRPEFQLGLWHKVEAAGAKKLALTFAIKITVFRG
jgi:hypothetical protein